MLKGPTGPMLAIRTDEAPEWARPGNPGRPDLVKNQRTESVGGAVRADRTGQWGNPFRMHGERMRHAVINRYRAKLWYDVRTGRLPLEKLAGIAGEKLACWCAPKPCHASVLAAAAIWAQERLKKERGQAAQSGSEADPEKKRGQADGVPPPVRPAATEGQQAGERSVQAAPEHGTR